MVRPLAPKPKPMPWVSDLRFITTLLRRFFNELPPAPASSVTSPSVAPESPERSETLARFATGPEALTFDIPTWMPAPNPSTLKGYSQFVPKLGRCRTPSPDCPPMPKLKDMDSIWIHGRF